MILVMLGTQDKSFERLLKMVSSEIEKGNIKEKVIVQAGYTQYKSPNMEIFDLIDAKKLDQLIKESSLIITHGGVGSIISSLKQNKNVIACPRLKKYKEHTNDHQCQIVNEFANAGYILTLNEDDKLSEVLEKSKKFVPKKLESNTKNMEKLIMDYINLDNHVSWFNYLKKYLVPILLVIILIIIMVKL